MTSVKGDDLVKTPVTNVSNGLAGRLPGVVAISNTAEPLIVVDGVPGRFLERIDPSTIESLSVMKSMPNTNNESANIILPEQTKK